MSRVNIFAFELTKFSNPSSEGEMKLKKKIKTVEDKPMISEKSYTEQLGYFTMVVEGMRYDMKSFGEKLDHFEIKMEEQKKELKAEIQFVQQALKASHHELKSDVQRVELRVEKIDHRLERVEQRVEKIDHRLERVENKIDKVADIIEHHDEEIVFLKTAIAKEAR